MAKYRSDPHMQQLFRLKDHILYYKDKTFIPLMEEI